MVIRKRKEDISRLALYLFSDYKLLLLSSPFFFLFFFSFFFFFPSFFPLFFSFFFFFRMRSASDASAELLAFLSPAHERLCAYGGAGLGVRSRPIMMHEVASHYAADFL